MEQFIQKWEKLSEAARTTINHGAQYEFGDELDVDDALRRATHEWDGYSREELRAYAFRVLVEYPFRTIAVVNIQRRVQGETARTAVIAGKATPFRSAKLFFPAQDAPRNITSKAPPSVS